MLLRRYHRPAVNRYKRKRAEPSWFGALKKEIVHVLQAQSTHIPAGVKPIVQPKCEPLATENCVRGAKFFRVDSIILSLTECDLGSGF